jgi:CelD/BcsL family acetyltransferase involved in cellulose biosynthesis
MLKTVEELAAVSELKGDWRRLAEARGNAFLTPEWFTSWFEQYGDNVRPFVPALQGADGTVRGLIPLALPLSGRPRVCRIAGANIGDAFGPLAEPGEEAEVAAAAGKALRDAPVPWSVLALDHAEAAETWVDGLAEGLGMRLRRQARSSTELPWVDLSAHDDWDSYLATRSSKLRKRLRWLDRRQGRDHSAAVRRTEAPDEVERDMATFFELHDRRWVGRGGSSLSSDRARAFHHRFAAAAQERGWLRLWFLEFDGAPVAAWYGWRIGERYAFYNGGLDPEHSKLSPGLVLLARVIESAFEEGARTFDFLLGDESYKVRFAEHSRSVTDLTLARPLPNPAALVVSAEHGLRSAGRLVPASTRQRLGLGRLARRSMLGGKRR